MSALFHPYLCGRNAAEWLITMDELNYKSAYLYLVGAVDDVIRYMEQMDRAAERGTVLAALRQALAEAEERAISTDYAAL